MYSVSIFTMLVDNFSKKNIVRLALVAVAILIGFIFIFILQFTRKEESATIATNFAECVAKGNPIMESYPRQCRDGNQTFTEDVGNELEKSDIIRLDSPRPNQVVNSPLVIKGEARGSWFFEASFPVFLTNWDGLIIAEGIATAKGDWMTSDFVPFEATLTFNADKNAYSDRGSLILKKDNPSGLSKNDDALEIPVIIGEASQPAGSGILPFKSGVSGKVLLGPTCPVERIPPDPNCADKPYQTTVQVIAVGSPKSSPFATVSSDKDGNYKIMLPPGEYALQPVGGKVLPRCETKTVTIEPDKVSEVNISCDTGIR